MQVARESTSINLFYLELMYDSQFPGMTTNDSIHKNGNINQMMWRTRGRERQAYNFSYDYLDRLRSAAYSDVSDGGTVTTNNRFNESLTYADARGNILNLKRLGGKINGACWDFAQIDNLTYSYTAGTNKISSIADAASATYKGKGFNPGAGTGSYAYDPNGNMTTDPYKSMTVQYNHLNLPKIFTFTGGAQSNTIEILYDAAGTKLRKIVKTGTTTNYTQDYIGGIEYRDGAREAIYTAEGRVFYTSPTTTRYEYSIKDHLGNARVSFTDKNANGYVDFATEVLQENHYYPFGLNMEGPWVNDAALDNRYQYNGKEFNDDFGLNLNDYGARWYDAGVGRWWVKDPLAEKYGSWSPFNYAANNPIIFVDPDGRYIDVSFQAKDENGKNQDVTVRYKEGKFYDTDGNEYAKESEFLNGVKESFDYLKEADGNGIISTFESDTENGITIKESKHMDLIYNKKKETVSYNLNSGLGWEENGEEKSQTPALGLLHEMAHGYLDTYGEEKGIEYDDQDDWIINNVEKPATEKLKNEDARDYHGQGFTYPTIGPTSTVEQPKRKKD